MIFLSLNQIKQILFEQNPVIAMVGVSRNPEKASHIVFKYFLDKGFKVFPVNPNLVNTKILGQECYPSLATIEKKIDMVDIFRAAEFIPEITQEVIKIKAKILWTQLGIVSKEAASLGKKAGLLVVMDECPKIILENSDCTN